MKKTVGGGGSWGGYEITPRNTKSAFLIIPYAPFFSLKVCRQGTHLRPYHGLGGTATLWEIQSKWHSWCSFCPADFAVCWPCPCRRQHHHHRVNRFRAGRRKGLEGWPDHCVQNNALVCPGCQGHFGRGDFDLWTGCKAFLGPRTLCQTANLLCNAPPPPPCRDTPFKMAFNAGRLVPLVTTKLSSNTALKTAFKPSCRLPSPSLLLSWTFPTAIPALLWSLRWSVPWQSLPSRTLGFLSDTTVGVSACGHPSLLQCYLRFGNWGSGSSLRSWNGFPGAEVKRLITHIT